MKTLAEVQEWCVGAEQEFGDASVPIGQVFARYTPLIPIESDEVLASWQDGKLAILLPVGWLPLEVDIDGARADQLTGNLEAFWIENICPGLWTLTPSLNIPGLIHVYIHVFGVPKSAPWEQKIVVASSIGR
jgi:hypothetical protein